MYMYVVTGPITAEACVQQRLNSVSINWVGLMEDIAGGTSPVIARPGVTCIMIYGI